MLLCRHESEKGRENMEKERKLNDYELEQKIERVEELREQVKNSGRCMEIYEHLKEINKGDILYGWIFDYDAILEEDLIDFATSYQKRYALDVMQVYANELENIVLKSDL